MKTVKSIANGGPKKVRLSTEVYILEHPSASNQPGNLWSVIHNKWLRIIVSHPHNRAGWHNVTPENDAVAMWFGVEQQYLKKVSNKVYRLACDEDEARNCVYQEFIGKRIRILVDSPHPHGDEGFVYVVCKERCLGNVGVLMKMLRRIR